MPSEPVVDLRSDTMTRPTVEMRAAMARADVGDDMWGEDPTVNRLEAMICERLGKEAAVFVVTATQANQIAVKVHCRPGDELLIEESGHIANYEAGGPAALSGVTCRTLRGTHGFLDLPELEGRIHDDDQHLSPTRLLCVENTTNLGGGRAWPVEQLHRVCQWAHRNGLKTHMDGARLMNASIATGQSPAKICADADTVTVCFSKGLGCPMGAVLAGSKEDIVAARRARKLFGGALRQAGIVAAAAVYALEHHVERLKVDHENAKLLAEGLAGIDGLRIEPDDVETNLVFVEVLSQLGTADEFSDRLAEHGVLAWGSGPRLIRACTHLDVDRDGIVRAIDAFRKCATL